MGEIMTDRIREVAKKVVEEAGDSCPDRSVDPSGEHREHYNEWWICEKCFKKEVSQALRDERKRCAEVARKIPCGIELVSLCEEIAQAIEADER